jgi:hypothetical protein
MSGSTSNNNIIGSGSDVIVLQIAEDQADGQDAQFTVNVDGQQIGGVQTVTASQSAGQTETFTFEGNYAPGTQDIAVTFGNNFIYPGTTGDRNLYVDGVTYDGQTISTTTAAIYNSPLVPPTSTVGSMYGNVVYTVNDTTAIPAGAPPNPTVSPAPVSVGTGADTLVLNMAEDPYQGDAQFTVSVDGQQIGGVQTTTAVFDDGQTQEFDVHGNFGAGTHTVSVDFLNDLVGGYYPPGTPDLPPGGPWALDLEDRNLYVMGMSLDGGAPSTDAPWEISSDGTANFTVTAGSNPSATDANSGLFASDGVAATSDNAAIPPGSLTAGSGSGGSSGGMSFLPPPTTPATGTGSGSGTGTSGSGTTVSGTTGSGGGATGTTSGQDTLTINAAGYGVQGVDPQFTVFVDGTQVGGVNTVSATEYDGTSSGGNQAFTFTGDWGAGPHTIGIDYLNNSTTSTGDLANLFVNSIQYDGSTTTEFTQNFSVSNGFLYQDGTKNFTGIAAAHG